MTVSTSTSRIEYTGDAVTTVFSFPYYFLANGDLKVYLDGVLQTITTHYTVAGAGVGAGGTVTFLTAPPNGDVVVIYREVAITQAVDYTPNDPFPANTHEQALDRLTMIAQRLDDRLDRALTLPDSSTATTPLTFADPVANNFLQWNAGATALQNASSVYGTVTVNTTSPLTGGGQLNVDRTIAIPAATASANGYMTSTYAGKLDGIEALADVTDATNVDAAGAVMNSDASTAAMSFVIDEDTMATNSATRVPTQQSTKAYVDTYSILHSDITPSDGMLIKTASETYSVLKTNRAATGAPTVNNDSSQGYAIGSDWIDTTNDNIYKATDVTVGAAVWVATGAAAGGVISVGATAPITSSGGTNPTIALADDGVTNAKLNNMATQTIKGRTTAGTGDPEDLTAAQASAIIKDVAETLTNKTLTTPTITSPSVNGALTGSAIGRGALVAKTANQTLTTATWTAIAFDSEAYDTETIHDNAVNNSRLVVPGGVTRIRLHATIAFDANATGLRAAHFVKNNTAAATSDYCATIYHPAIAGPTVCLIQLSTPVLSVVAADYFICAGYQTSGGDLDVLGGFSYYTYFNMEIIK